MKEYAAADHVKNDLTLHKSSASLGNAMRQPRLDIHPLFGLSRQNLCTGSNRSLAVLQPKLVVGPADDEYEREADRVAEQAVSMQEPTVQRACPSCEEDEPLQREPLAARITPLVQRQAAAEEEEELQTTPMIQRQGAEEEDEEKLQTAPEVAGSKGGPAVPDLEQSLEQARAGGRPLAEGFRGRMENAFEADFSSVRIHADEPADRLSRSIQARAFTRGQDIFLRQGEYQPASAVGQRLLAHELTHVVQQMNDRMSPTQKMGEAVITSDIGLEREADFMGKRAFDKMLVPMRSNEHFEPKLNTMISNFPTINGFASIIQLESKVKGKFLDPTPNGELNAYSNPMHHPFWIKALFELKNPEKQSIEDLQFGEYRQKVKGYFKDKDGKEGDHFLGNQKMEKENFIEDITDQGIKYGYHRRSRSIFTDTDIVPDPNKSYYNDLIKKDNGKFHYCWDDPSSVIDDSEMHLEFEGKLIDIGNNHQELDKRYWSINGRKESS